jgi:hypothetical protein
MYIGESLFKKSPEQTFHIGRIGVSWDDNYIEYGLTTEISTNVKPGILEYYVDETISRSAIIEIWYYPVIFTGWETEKVGTEIFEFKKYRISPTPKAYRTYIPAYTRKGTIIPTDVKDFGFFIMAVVSADFVGKLHVDIIIGEGAKIFHALVNRSLTNVIEALKNSLLPINICPVCGGLTKDCPVCNGKHVLADDVNSQEYFLIEFLKHQKTPYTDEGYWRKVGMAYASHYFVNPSEQGIKDFIGRMFDVSPTSIVITTYTKNQNICVVVSVPPSIGTNAFLGIDDLQWLLDTIRPVGIELIGAIGTGAFDEYLGFEGLDTNVDRDYRDNEVVGIKWW